MSGQRPEFQDPARRAAAQAAAPAAPPVPQQAAIEGLEPPTAPSAPPAPDDPDALDAVAAKAAAKGSTAPTQPWPASLPEQMRAVAQLLAASPAPLPLPAIEAAFKGRGAWKKGLPRILETLEALGRARFDTAASGWRG